MKGQLLVGKSNGGLTTTGRVISQQDSLKGFNFKQFAKTESNDVQYVKILIQRNCRCSGHRVGQKKHRITRIKTHLESDSSM